MNGAYVSFVKSHTAAFAHNYTAWSSTQGRYEGSMADAMRRGAPMDPALLPDQLVQSEGRGGAPAGTTTERAVILTDLLFVKSEVADVLRAHDLGAGFLWPVTALKPDRKTKLPETWFGLHIGAWKDSLRSDLTTAMGDGVALGGGKVGWSLSINKIESGSGDVVLDPGALDGADLWQEEKLKLGNAPPFLSLRLHNALRDAGMIDEFHCAPCATEYVVPDR